MKTIVKLEICYCWVATHMSDLKSQQRPTRAMFVYRIPLNPIHTILKYGDYHDFMDR